MTETKEFLLLILLSILITASCGGNYNVHTDPIQVNVNVSFSDLTDGFKAQCRRENPDYTDAQISQCASDKLATLMMDIDSAVKGT